MAYDLEILKSKEISPLEEKGYNLAYQASVEGMVLLENNGVLPLQSPGRAGSKVALYGYGARHTMVRGIGSGDITLRYETTIEQGLEDAGFTITSIRWLDTFDRIYKEYRDVLRAELQEESRRTGIDELHLYYARDHVLPVSLDVTEEYLTPNEDGDETAIYVMTRKEGEGNDNLYTKGEYLPADHELSSLRALRGHYQKLILLLNVGSPVDLSEIRKIGPDAILLVYQGTAEMGHAVASILIGNENPSGRLPSTWTEDYWDHPNSKEFGYNDGDTANERYREGLYIGYRYFDTFGKKPLYPFGYGLSYTTFAIKADTLTGQAGRITLSGVVQNTGEIPGKEVVQLYVSLPGEKLDQPKKQLAAFYKTDEIEPGEEEVFEITFYMEDLASFSEEKSAYLLEAGDYILYVGKSSDSVAAAGVVRLTGERVTRKTRHLFKRNILFDVLKAPKRQLSAFDYALLESLPRVEVDPDDIPSDGAVIYSGEPVNYFSCAPEEVNVNTGSGECVFLDAPADLTLDDVKNARCTMEEFVSTLSEEELIHLIVGQAFVHPKYQMSAMSTHVIGACGESTNFFLPEWAARDGRVDRKIPYTVLADGPAGLRLIPRAQVDAQGKMLFVDPVLNYENGDFSKDPGYAEPGQGYEDIWQYVTGLPIGVQLSSTWNTDLIYQLGDQIGQEMERYDVDTLLAPGINLHRNPLCGRNFEYYSEDPVVTAEIAIAFVKGLESHPGKAACIKHYAANNQEAARYAHNSVVSERTMRDLYLKAFELTVKYASPKTLMTSLNCVNGPHAANNRDLGIYVLRDEWGFDGLVMTDWNTTSLQRGASTIGCVNAGNDLMMPGAELDYERLRKALHTAPEDGESVDIGALQRNAMHVLEYIIGCGRS